MVGHGWMDGWVVWNGLGELTVLLELKADFAHDLQPMPVHLVTRVLLRPPRSGDAAPLHAAALRVGVVQAVELLFEVADLILQVKQDAVVQGFESSVQRFQRRWWSTTAAATAAAAVVFSSWGYAGAESRSDELVSRQGYSLWSWWKRKGALIRGARSRCVRRHVRLLVQGGIGKIGWAMTPSPNLFRIYSGGNRSAHCAFLLPINASLRARATVRLVILDHIGRIVLESTRCRRRAPVRGRRALRGHGRLMRGDCLDGMLYHIGGQVRRVRV